MAAAKESHGNNYRDRAAERREVHADDPDVPDCVHASQPVSVEAPLTASHKGFQMLAKLGWKEGHGLGKTSSGSIAPVPMIGNVTRGGIGSEGAVTVVEGAADVVDAQRRLKRMDDRKAAIREITVKRYLEADDDGTDLNAISEEVAVAKPKFSLALKKPKNVMRS